MSFDKDNDGWAMLTSGKVIVSEFNRLEDGRYFDVESQTSFEVDHVTQVRRHNKTRGVDGG